MKKLSWLPLVRLFLAKTSQARTARRLRRSSATEFLESRVLLSAVAEFVDPHPVAGDQFGSSVTVLTNGNVVVMVQNDDAGGGDSSQTLDVGAGGAGAVYLFNGQSGALISTLTGSHAGDLFRAQIVPLANGNFVVNALNWNGGFGAATWGSGTTGVNGTIDGSNSLIGSTNTDHIGQEGVTALTNGNYVVCSPTWKNGSVARAGAATWADGTTGITGTVSAGNSLIGVSAFDQVGDGATALTNGNYVVSSQWSNGSVLQVGAATWANGATGLTGTISINNSLVGSHANDFVGGAIALSNGNYVVKQETWNNNIGAVTWGNGATGITGTVSTSNSLTGTASGDRIGHGLTTLSNGNYVVISTFWQNSTGAATWVDGSKPIVATVSSNNSLVGSASGDSVGDAGVFELTNGNFVVDSIGWNLGAGAVTWESGTSGRTGPISADNSVVGSQSGDVVGDFGVVALSNGNYVVRAPLWHNGTKANAGAATWGDGTIGTTGAVGPSISLVGTDADDFVGSVITPLTNGNYVVGSPWSLNSLKNLGAVTWGSGTSGVMGAVSLNNSLVGSQEGDFVGDKVTALADGNYLVGSSRWANGSAQTAGALTWVNGASAVTGIVSSSNSLVGANAGDQFTSGGITLLGTGNYVVLSPSWNNLIGAATFFEPSTPTTGTYDPATLNSAVGQQVSTSGVQRLTVDDTHNRFFVSFPFDGAGHIYRGDSFNGFLMPPSDITLSNTTIPDNTPIGSTVGTLSATDLDQGATFSFSLGNSADDQAFSINGNHLVLNATLNAGVQSTYHIDVTVTDSNGLSFTKSFVITVISSPSQLSLTPTQVYEGQPTGTAIGTFSATELGTGHTFTYSLVPGAANNANFTISGNTLKTAAVFNAATKSSYSILAQVKDENGSTLQKSFTIIVLPFPTAIQLSKSKVNEAQPSGTTVGTFSTTESGSGHTFTYTLASGGVNNSSFAISGNTLKTAAVFSAVTKSSYSIRVQVEDENSNKFQQTLTITVLPIPTAINLSNANVKEGQPSGTAVGNLSTTQTGTGHSYTYTLVPGVLNNAWFTIGGNTLKTAATFNAAAKSSYLIRVQVQDENGNTFQQQFTITVLPAPTAILLSNSKVNEGLPSGTTVGTLSTIEHLPPHTFTYSLVPGAADNANFTISGNVLKTAAVFIAATKSSYSVKVQVQDENGNTFQQLLTITVANSPYALSLTPAKVNEGQPSGTTVGTFSTTESGTGHTYTYTLVPGALNNSYFTITGNTLKTAATFNAAVKSTYIISAQVQDENGKIYRQSLTITVVPVPTAIMLSNNKVNEGLPSGTTVGTLSTAEHLPPHTYTYILVPGAADNANFTITGNVLKTAAVFIAATKSSYSVQIQVQDENGNTFQQSLTITVANSPYALSVTPAKVNEGQPSGTTVGAFSTTESGTGHTYTYTLPTATLNNAWFTISGNTLKTAGVFNAATKSSYLVQVQVQDENGKLYRQTLTITVLPVPTAIKLSISKVNEGKPSGTAIGTLSTTEHLPPHTYTYTLVPGALDNANFTISGNVLKTAAVFNAATKSSYSVQVQVQDENGNTFRQTLSITVLPVPTAISLSNSKVNEGMASGASIGTLSTTQTGTGHTYTYTLVPGAANNSQFTISGNTLKTAAVFSATTKSSYSVQVQVQDENGNTFKQLLTITVLPVPTAISLSNTNVNELQPSGAIVGTLSTAEALPPHTYTYTLVSGVADNASFTISGNTVKTAATLNAETKSSYSIRVQVQDENGNTFQQSLTINVLPVPTAINLSKSSVTGGKPAGTTVGTLTTVEHLSIHTYVYSLVPGAADNANFTIDGNLLKTAAVFNAATKSSYTVLIQVKEDNGNSLQQSFTITVT